MFITFSHLRRCLLVLAISGAATLSAQQTVKLSNDTYDGYHWGTFYWSTTVAWQTFPADVEVFFAHLANPTDAAAICLNLTAVDHLDGAVHIVPMLQYSASGIGTPVIIRASATTQLVATQHTTPTEWTEAECKSWNISKSDNSTFVGTDDWKTITTTDELGNIYYALDSVDGQIGFYIRTSANEDELLPHSAYLMISRGNFSGDVPNYIPMHVVSPQPTDIEATQQQPADAPRKRLVNGQLILERNEQYFTLTGQLL